MSAPTWGERPLPPLGSDSATWDGRPCALADITQLRLQLRAGLADGARPRGADEDDVERLLLIFEELASNGLRHGRAPVRVVVTTSKTGWLIDVSDAATGSPPAPAVGRDAANGGLGLYLVDRLSDAHGWTMQDDRKHVWAQLDYASSAGASSAPPVPVPPFPGPCTGPTVPTPLP
jgi:anti-sigma regulatory factor (Ser/Thr protein kinase)